MELIHLPCAALDLEANMRPAHSFRWIWRSLFAALLLFPSAVVPAEARAQDSAGASESWFRPFLFAGATAGYLDFFESRRGGSGLSGRVGVRLSWMDVGVVGEHWTDWGGYRLSSVLLETNHFPFGTAGFAPYVLVGVGRVSYRHISSEGSRRGGANASLGVGVQTGLLGHAALRAEAVLRNDDTAFNGQIRLGLGYATSAPPRPRQSRTPRSDFFMSWMAPARGPWRFVEPGYGVRFAQPLNEHLSTSVGFEVYHWQIPGSAMMRDYIWDTRAFVGTPGLEWRLAGSHPLSLRAGPTVLMMGEGPDAGLNLGLHAAASTELNSRGVPWSLGAGWLWWPRSGDEDPRVSPNQDQLGLMLFGGLAL